MVLSPVEPQSCGRQQLALGRKFNQSLENVDGGAVHGEAVYGGAVYGGAVYGGSRAEPCVGEPCVGLALLALPVVGPPGGYSGRTLEDGYSGHTLEGRLLSAYFGVPRMKSHIDANAWQREPVSRMKSWIE